MLSESARMSSAAEARFRVQAPNSTPRAIKVIALDEASEAVVRRLAAGGWKHATFFSAVSPAETGDRSRAPAGGTLSDLEGHVRSVSDEVDTADLIIFVAGPGGHAQAASIIGQECSRRRVMTNGFIVGIRSASEEAPGINEGNEVNEAKEAQEALSRTLTQLRPWSLMVVIANNDEYIDDVMTALRA